MTTIIDGTSGISTPMYNGSITANPVTPSVNMKNRCINGNMVIDQRNAGASATNLGTGTYYLDRWLGTGNVTSKFSVQQNAGSVTPPVGFSNYLGVTSLSSYSVSSSDVFLIRQAIEGFNTADLAFGTANAKTVTLSFWVYSSLTGTFGGALYNNGGSRSYPFTYTISSANTWTQASVTIAGDTSGTWIGATNGIGLYVSFNLGAGSTVSGTAGSWASGYYPSATGATSVVGTNGATFYITGVQLEVGSTASSFDYRPYGTELALCQRYYTVVDSSTQYLGAYTFSTNRVLSSFSYPTTMRTVPTVTSGGTVYFFTNAGAFIASSAAFVPTKTGTCQLDLTVTATSGAAGVCALGTATYFSAEL